jgi:hypothetical protein
MQLPQNFSDLVSECPQNLEIRRIAQLTPVRQDIYWKHIRASLSVFDRFFRHFGHRCSLLSLPSERGYCQRLSQLKPYVCRNGKVALSVDLIRLSTSWVSGQWKDTLPSDPRQRHPCPLSGDLADPDASNVALDSAFALRDGSLRCNTGDIGRLLEEIRQEYKNT